MGKLLDKYRAFERRHPLAVRMVETLAIAVAVAAVAALSARAMRSTRHESAPDDVSNASSDSDAASVVEPPRDIWFSGAGMFDNQEDAIQSHIDIYGKGW
ncbi:MULTISPECIES: hypothetical protein [Paraburkholderia]|uniref:hypothetical protein n=1 Tax=Paraburkholderia TaxID=1822464 RepID=UPI0038BBF984